MLSGSKGFLLQQAGPWWLFHPRAAYPGRAGAQQETEKPRRYTRYPAHHRSQSPSRAPGHGYPMRPGSRPEGPEPRPSPDSRRRLASGSAHGAAWGGGHASQPSERVRRPLTPRLLGKTCPPEALLFLFFHTEYSLLLLYAHFTENQEVT